MASPETSGTVLGDVLERLRPFLAQPEFRALADSLRADCNVYVLDLLGFGYSDKPHPYAYTLMEQAALVNEWIASMGSGAVHMVIEDDFGKVRDLDHGLINGSIARERWTTHPDDPLCASGQIHWTDEIERDDIRLRTETKCAMWSDATDFHLSATLTAYENDVEIFAKEVKETIPRDHM